MFGWLVSVLIVLLLAGCHASYPGKANLLMKVPQVTTANAVEQSKAHIALALLMIEQKNYSRAKDELFAAKALSPKLPRLAYSFGYYYEQVGELTMAKRYYQQALKLAPDSPYVQNSYGAFLCRTGKPKQAIRYFLSAIRYPSFDEVALAYRNAGLCAEKSGNVALAKYYFNKARQHQTGASS